MPISGDRTLQLESLSDASPIIRVNSATSWTVACVLTKVVLSSAICQVDTVLSLEQRPERRCLTSSGRLRERTGRAVRVHAGDAGEVRDAAWSR